VTDQSSLRDSPRVNLRASLASVPLAGTLGPDRLAPAGAELAAGWVVCQICGRQGRWVNPFPR
jgi:hypothetical protein